MRWPGEMPSNLRIHAKVLWPILVLVGSFTVGCSESSLQHCVASVFRDFRLVGEYPLLWNLSYSEPTAAANLPFSFQCGKVYVFQSIGPVSTERIAIQDFPTRLRSAGARVLWAPRDPGDFASVDLGGLLWEV